MEKDLIRIRKLHAKLAKDRKVYDIHNPSPISHAKDYEAQPERLARYSTQVVNARIMLLFVTTIYKTYHFLDTYLYGVDRLNPFAVLGAARSQMEIHAVTWDTIETVRISSTKEGSSFVDRVAAVDVALIRAYYGTRSEHVKEMLRLMPGVDHLRTVRKEDVDHVQSTNILTRIDRLSKVEEHRDIRRIYDRLCEYLHPNIAQNMILISPFPIQMNVDGRNVNLMRIERSGGSAIEYALTASVKAMADSAEQTIALLDEWTPPFGAGVATMDVTPEA